MINLSGKMRNSLTNFKKEKKSSPIIITSDSWGSSQSITDIHNNNNTAGTDDKDWESNYLTSPSLSTFSSSKSSHTRTTTNSSISFKSMEFGFGAFKFGGASTNSPSSKNTTHITNGSGESSYSGDSSSTSTYNPNTNGTVTGFENDTTQSKVANYDIFGKSLDIAKESDFGYETVDLLSPNNLSGSSVTSTYDLLKFVPLLVLKCVLFLSEYGLEEEGLYRISGSSVDVKKLRKKFENGEYGLIF